MKILSINISEPKTIDHNGKSIQTAIFKNPITGPIHVGSTNLAGDRQADLTVHGGQYKAIYAYPHEHYAHWQNELQRDDFTYGQFGENLTTQGLLEETVHIGDTFRIGTALLQITQPREPCFKLALRMNQPDFPKRFLTSGRVGFYLQVIHEGDIQTGDPIELIQKDPEQITIKQAWTLMYNDRHNQKQIHRLLTINALGPQWRTTFQKRLDQTP